MRETNKSFRLRGRSIACDFGIKNMPDIDIREMEMVDKAEQDIQ